MKKIYFLLAAAVLAFSFASCNKKNNGNQPDDPTTDTTTVTPTEEAFVITVSDITPLGATVSVTPANKDGYYYWTIFSKSYADQFKNVDEFAAAVIKDEIEYYENDFESLVDDGYIVKGDDSWTFNLLPSHAYVAIAFPVDEELNITGTGAMKDFATTELPITSTVALEMGSGSYFWEFYESYGLGVLNIVSADEAQFIELGLNFLAESASGHFSADDCYDPWASYDYYDNYIYNYNTDAESHFAIVDVTGSLNESESTYTFSGYVVTEEGVKYTFESTTVVEDTEELGDEVSARKAAKPAVQAIKNVKQALRAKAAQKIRK